MTDIEKRAHDLTLLYMQLEIKEEQIVTQLNDDYKGFVFEYKNIYSHIISELEQS